MEFASSGGGTRRKRQAPDVAEWQGIQLQRPVWGGLSNAAVCVQTSNVSDAEASVSSESFAATGSAPQGVPGGDDALGAHHIVCGEGGGPSLPDGEQDMWSYLTQDSDDDAGDDADLRDGGLTDCTMHAPLALDGTIFNSGLIANMLLLRHKVGLMRRE